MTKKLYSINVHYDAVAHVKVAANSKEEAEELALEKANDVPYKDMDIEYSEMCITDIEDLN